MSRFVAALLALAAAPLAPGRLLRTQRQEPDTSCGKGFEGLVPGSKKYLDTAMAALWVHPGRTGQSGTFQREVQCWYANLLTTSCGGLPSQRDARVADLTAKCTGLEADWIKIWNMFSKAEADWYRANFPAESLIPDNSSSIHYKQAMKTTYDLNKKEMLCLTLFVIDDECGAHEYIRTA
mmetsp:Transcript_91710/g.258932  ORF Transcript_91710/g.258932 Transcript_91710/m.258932 type:complete len:180 (-) Transcript_91710:77-616(-)